VAGSFDRTFQIMADARGCALPLQVNTTIARHNIHQVDGIAEQLANQNIELWSVFFLVPTGRASAQQRITADEYEQVFERLLTHSRTKPYAIKTTEAPHYRRFVMRRHKIDPAASPAKATRFAGTNDGKGVLFISHTGEIYPSGFLPIECGVFPRDSVVTVYQQNATFRALRDGDLLGGKCGRCEFRHVCGGSRARSFALTGDLLAAEPDCNYQPGEPAEGLLLVECSD
jgi:radical SAM protein with 4Fe4S-binding SPASM domain